MKSKTIFHVEGLWSPTWHFTCLPFYKSRGIQLQDPGSYKVKVSEREKIKVIEGKSEGHFTIYDLFVKKLRSNGQKKTSNY